MAEEVPKMASVIKLNVGGTYFTTSRTTLNKFSDCMLAIMFSGISFHYTSKTLFLRSLGRHKIEKGDDGAYFIDRNPKYFEKILDYLRDGEIFLPTTKRECYELAKEANYYGLPSLVEAVNRQSPTV